MHGDCNDDPFLKSDRDVGASSLYETPQEQLERFQKALRDLPTGERFVCAEECEGENDVSSRQA